MQRDWELAMILLRTEYDRRSYRWGVKSDTVISRAAACRSRRVPPVSIFRR